uniref:Uncharacterized protein n=1 Tax=Rhipicephalus appendiculatus TaxID=34631 RepID=A0A131YCM1_RHIAP
MFQDTCKARPNEVLTEPKSERITSGEHLPSIHGPNMKKRIKIHNLANWLFGLRQETKETETLTFILPLNNQLFKANTTSIFFRRIMQA